MPACSTRNKLCAFLTGHIDAIRCPLNESSANVSARRLLSVTRKQSDADAAPHLGCSCDEGRSSRERGNWSLLAVCKRVTWLKQLSTRLMFFKDCLDYPVLCVLHVQSGFLIVMKKCAVLTKADEQLFSETFEELVMKHCQACCKVGQSKSANLLEMRTRLDRVRSQMVFHWPIHLTLSDSFSSFADEKTALISKLPIQCATKALKRSLSRGGYVANHFSSKSTTTCFDARPKE